MHRDPLHQHVQTCLNATGPKTARVLAALDSILSQLDCTVGSIHRLDTGTQLLKLEVQRGIPSALLERVTAIPIGKGMAGLAAQCLEPVQVCNVQNDKSGVTKPGAREAPVQGSIAVPIMAGPELRGVLGVAKPLEYEFTAEEISCLQRVAEVLAQFMGEPA